MRKGHQNSFNQMATLRERPTKKGTEKKERKKEKAFHFHSVSVTSKEKTSSFFTFLYFRRYIKKNPKYPKVHFCIYHPKHKRLF